MELFLHRLLEGIVENVAHGPLTQRLLIQFFSTSQFDPRFYLILVEVANLLFSNYSARQLAVAIMTLCKVAVENEAETSHLKYRFGLSRKHTALQMLQQILDTMHRNSLLAGEKKLDDDEPEIDEDDENDKDDMPDFDEVDEKEESEEKAHDDGEDEDDDIPADEPANFIERRMR